MNYQKQANDFLKRNRLTFTCRFIEHGLHFEDDKEARDIYDLTITRVSMTKDSGISKTFRFGQSMAYSRKYKNGCQISKTVKEPTAYDLLACITKSDPGTFEDFCSKFGYNEDSRTDERIYNAVTKEWADVEELFSETEIDELQEIQ